MDDDAEVAARQAEYQRFFEATGHPPFVWWPDATPQLDDESVLKILNGWNEQGVARERVDSRECDAHKDVVTAQEAVRRAHRVLMRRGPGRQAVNLVLCDECLRAAGVAI